MADDSSFFSAADLATLQAFARPITVDKAEQYREEGRREILAEIAAIDPVVYFSHSDIWQCVLCGTTSEGSASVHRHEQNCLSVRAQSLTSEAK